MKSLSKDGVEKGNALCEVKEDESGKGSQRVWWDGNEEVIKSISSSEKRICGRA
jgi:hypothetical protein